MTRRSLSTVLVLAALAGCETGVVDPAMVDGGYLDVAVGGEFSCGLTRGGSLYCWGNNRSGQLGSDAGPSSPVPVRIASGTRFTTVTAGGQHACGIDAEGSLFCWGSNQRGQLGNASRINQGVPVGSAPAMRFAHVSAGWFHTCALTMDGLAYCWGASGQSQAGGAAGDDVLEPRRVSDMQFASITAGGFHTCALDGSGRVHCWGANHVGQLGDGGTTNRAAPQLLAGDQQYNQVAAGYTHTCAIRTVDNRPACWGSSEYGEIGNGGASLPGMAGSTEPAPVHGDQYALFIAAGYSASCMIDSRAIGWCWGRGDDGQLGTGATWDSWTPQYVMAGVIDGALTTPNVDFLRISMGLRHACGLTTAQSIFCWGRGAEGQLGAGSIAYSPLPVRVGATR